MSNLIELFPEIAERHYYQDSETGEFWFHATGVCNALGFSNVGRSLQAYTDEDERYQDVHNGKATWFVSESGCYGLAMAAKTDAAKKFKRWLKHEILPKLRRRGGVIVDHDQYLATADSEEVARLKAVIADREALIEQRTKQLGQAERMVMCGKDIHDRTQLLLDMVDYRDSWDDMYDRGECTERQKFTIQNYVHELRWGLAEEGFSTAVVQRSFEMVKEFAGRLVQKDPIRKRDLDSVFREQFKSVFYSYGLPVKAAKNAKDGKGGGKTSSKKTLAK